MLHTGYLPHHIHGGLIELWSRLDNRLKLKDLSDRMEARHDLPSHGLLSDRHTRFRDDHGILNWSSTKYPTQTEVKIFQSLSREQILMNTTMVSITLAANCLPRYAVNNSVEDH